MKQILQDLAKGDTLLVEIPQPSSKVGHLLIQSNNSVISAGTERMLVDFGKANVFQKARQQPEKVKMVLNKVKTDGLMPTLEAVKSKLDQPMPLGYCNSGIVINSGVAGFNVDDRVVSNGPHAEVVRVSGNLCVKIPDQVDDESAAFTVLGSIALQGIRLAEPTIGEAVAVIGLGLIGLIAVQILKANGCRVIGIDFDANKCELAKEFGAETVNLADGEDPLVVAQSFSRGRGMDAVLITAATTSNEPMSQAANMLRKRGRIILIGVVGLELSRAELYEKEITFQVSCSYGPGRYDTEYEDKGHDYPIGFVRWTEQRNFEAILDMMSTGVIDVKPLITHRYSFDDALSGYQQLDNSQALGIVLEYDTAKDLSAQKTIKLNSDAINYCKSDAICGFLGGGNYASRILIPAFKNAGAKLDTLVTSGGVSAVHQGKKHGFTTATTEETCVLDNQVINTAVIVTQHNLHASQVNKAIASELNVFVEKPIAINHEELDKIIKSYESIKGNKPRVMIGFNRRFAPHVVKMKSLLAQNRVPKSLIMTVNAGDIPKEHWTQDREIGGGRIIGECCHFIDLFRFLVGHKVIGFTTTMIGDVPGIETRDDKVSINLTFEDGSFGTIHYFANGGKSFPKERLEVFCNDAVLQMDNFRKMRGFGWKGFNKMNLFNQDKGQSDCVKAFVDSINNGTTSPISFEEVIEVSRLTIDIAESLTV